MDALLFVDAVHDPSNCPQGVFRCRTVTINYDVLDNSIAAGLGSTIKINPFEDSVFEAVLTFSEIDTQEVPVRKTWLGTIAGHQFSSVAFTYRVQQHLVGNFTCPSTYPKNYFAITPLPGGSGRHRILETDPRNTPQH